MPKFVYYHLDRSVCDQDLLGERIRANEWSAQSRMGGVPAFDSALPASEQPHHTSLCDDTCTKEPSASGKIHCPPGVPLPYTWCETHGSWATLTPVQPPRPPGA